MADGLTRIQDCLDQLSVQFYASLRYLSTHHSSSSLESPPNPHNPPFPATDTAPTQRPDSPATFAGAQKELAEDLVAKVREIEELVGSLEGLGKSEESQKQRLGELDALLREAEEERKAAVVGRDEAIEQLNQAIARVAS
ncbi:MAG: hypothetical protein LQ346_007046 [Caloplaca aetnensis]|nr:MAG: hypothetical protein LQ346_007046 [Caloplaca aetnensis]